MIRSANSITRQEKGQFRPYSTCHHGQKMQRTNVVRVSINAAGPSTEEEETSLFSIAIKTSKNRVTKIN